jgi:hypothetical protein
MMAQGYASELVGVRDGTASPEKKSDGRVQGARVRRSRATLVANDVAAASGDTNILFTLPKGCGFMGIEVTASASQTTSTLAFGTADAATSLATAKAYGTAANAVVDYGLATAKAATPSDEDREIIVTVGTAAITAGSTLVIDLLYSGR